MGKTTCAVRRPNFSEDEKHAIVDGVAPHFEVLGGKLSSTVTSQTKDKLWREVLDKVNAVSTAQPPRELEEIKKKWQCLKSDTKAAAALIVKEIRKTGGGEAEAPELDEIGRKIIQVIPTVEVEGIRGGIDVSQLSADRNSTVDMTAVAVLVTPPTQQQSQTPPTQPTPSASNRFTHSAAAKDYDKNRKRAPETTMYALQAKQVRLMEEQLRELKRIGDLMKERNAIEVKKLSVMSKEEL